MSCQMEMGNEQIAILERAQHFVEALKATPAYCRFASADRRFRADLEAQQIVQELQEMTAEFHQAKRAGTLGQEQVQEVLEAQARLRDHPLIRDFMQARDEVELLLQDTNRAISEVLGFDFGRAAGPARRSC